MQIFAIRFLLCDGYRDGAGFAARFAAKSN
jgi:hypothetical protein